MIKLNQKKDFKKIVELGQGFFEQEFGFKILKNNLSHNRYAIIVSLKVDKRAVVRNKIRRRLNEVLRLYNPTLKQGFDVLVLTRAPIKDLNYQVMKDKLERLFKKAKLVKNG